MLKLNKLKMSALIIALSFCGNVALACESDGLESKPAVEVKPQGEQTGNS